jgi:thiol:disulfide interchange protein DsbG
MKLANPLPFGLLIALGLGSAHAAEDLPAPIRMVESKGARVIGQFDAPDGLKGYAAEYEGQAMALYLTADGKHVLSGRLFDAQGNDLSREPLERLVFAPMAKEMWAKMANSTWIADGKADAPRIVYVFTDPNCPYCTMFWQQARPWVESGKVQLRHVMVGIIKPDSLAKAATLLADADPAKALHDHELAGKSSPLKATSRIPEAIQQKLDANMTLADQMGVNATPSIFYLNDKGRMEQVQGAPRPEQLEQILGGS